MYVICEYRASSWNDVTHTSHSAYHYLYELSGSVARTVESLRKREVAAILEADKLPETRRADMIFEYMTQNGNIKTVRGCKIGQMAV